MRISCSISFVVSRVIPFGCFMVRSGNIGACGFQLAPKNLRLPLIQLENHPVEAPVCINILQSYGVVLLVGEQADDSAASVWRRGFCQHQRHTADLPILLAEVDVLNETNGY